MSGNPQMIRDFSHAYCTILTFSHTLRPPSLSLDLFVSAMEMLTSALSPALESFPAYVTDTCSFMSLSTWSWPPLSGLDMLQQGISLYHRVDRRSLPYCTLSLVQASPITQWSAHKLWDQWEVLFLGYLWGRCKETSLHLAVDNILAPKGPPLTTPDTQSFHYTPHIWRLWFYLQHKSLSQ